MVYRKKEIAWVHGSCVPLKDGEGNITGLMGTVIDMTERRRTLDALAASEAKFRLLVERAPFGVIVLRDLRMVYANRTFLELLSSRQASSFVAPERRPVSDEPESGTVLVSVELLLQDSEGDTAEAEVRRWYDEEHVEMLSKIPGWLRSRVFRPASPDGRRHWLAVAGR